MSPSHPFHLPRLPPFSFLSSKMCAWDRNLRRVRQDSSLCDCCSASGPSRSISCLWARCHPPKSLRHKNATTKRVRAQHVRSADGQIVTWMPQTLARKTPHKSDLIFALSPRTPNAKKRERTLELGKWSGRYARVE